MARGAVAGSVAAAGFGDADEVLREVLRRTEASYLAAGDDLVASVDLLRLLGGQFDRLRVTFGPENGDRLAALIDGTRDHVGQVQAGFDSFLAASDSLRLAVRGVRVEVADLDRVVRTIANVSINARIQGNGLIPPRPQVTAFIERLAVMAAEAEGILAEVREAMSVIGADMAAMEEVTQELREELGHRVLPALGRFGRVAEGVLSRQGELARTNAALAGQMEMIDADVARLVIGLQSGDATRQRLEAVRGILAEARSGDRDEALLLELTQALVAHAVETAGAEIAVSVRTAESVRAEAEQTVAKARSFYLAPAASTGGVEAFDGALDRVRGRLDEMRQRAVDLRERLGTILKHETALRQIGHQVRLSGLNAVLICAKLGEEGRALRELAQWLRTLTDESDAIVLRLQEVLGRTAALADGLGGDRIAGLDAALQGFFADAGSLGAVMADIGQGRGDAARLFDAAGQSLPLRLRQAEQHLLRFQLLLREMAFVDAALAARRAMLGPRPPLDAEGAARMLALRKGYTMQSERDLHDRIVGGALASGVEGAALAVAAAVPTAPVAAGDDLDDILF
ncbi:hypothetical protein H7F16_01340 [Gemmobacter straminiformis]|uniref:Methyl-accepting chemotaxis protein n=2 Tax=Paragemmobacter straminiformis TaxID=2045119 RepID=A0A842I3F0_9RHOB|nr:hypothetical protein [Gemmobacter straminiformis]